MHHLSSGKSAGNCRSKERKFQRVQNTKIKQNPKLSNDNWRKKMPRVLGAVVFRVALVIYSGFTAPETRSAAAARTDDDTRAHSRQCTLGIARRVQVRLLLFGPPTSDLATPSHNCSKWRKDRSKTAHLIPTLPASACTVRVLHRRSVCYAGKPTLRRGNTMKQRASSHPVFFQCQTNQPGVANQAPSFYCDHSLPTASLPSALVA